MYIENNPLRAGLCKKPEDYTYSSARAHILGQRDELLKESVFGRGELNEYKRFMRKEQNQETLEEIRGKTRLGKPLGDERFLTVLSGRLGRLLDFRSKGRPRKLSR
jgi:putative transposase